MVKCVIVVRESGKQKPDYSLDFDLPEIPKIGDYISIQRPDKPEPYGEDMIVCQVWWRLNHPETGAVSSNKKVGNLNEVLVECEPAISPYSSDQWRDSLSSSGCPEFKVSRFSIRQDQK